MFKLVHKYMVDKCMLGILLIGGSRRGTRDTCPLRVQILSISCSFWEKYANNSFSHSSLELVPPPWGNPGSATATEMLSFLLIQLHTM